MVTVRQKIAQVLDIWEEDMPEVFDEYSLEEQYVIVKRVVPKATFYDFHVVYAEQYDNTRVAEVKEHRHYFLEHGVWLDAVMR